jgi:predicted RNA methylase
MEPSAGDGSFTEAIRETGADVVGIERDPVLESRHGFKCADFLNVGPDCSDVNGNCIGNLNMVIMNPPYENNADLEHVIHAFSFSDRVVCLVRLNFLTGKERKSRLWSKHTLTRMILLSTRPKFCGETDGSPKHDFAVCYIRDGRTTKSTQLTVEWW